MKLAKGGRQQRASVSDLLLIIQIGIGRPPAENFGVGLVAEGLKGATEALKAATTHAPVLAAVPQLAGFVEIMIKNDLVRRQLKS